MSLDANTQKVVDALNKARAMELQAIHQYMLQHFQLDDMDYGTLCGRMKLIAIDEMKHAEKFAERIVALGGEPTCDSDGPTVQPQTVPEIYVYDVNLETDTIKTYEELADICKKCGDGESAGIFSDVIKDERVHLGYYSDTDRHIKTLGDVFLAKYASTSKHSGPVKSFVKVMKEEDF